MDLTGYQHLHEEAMDAMRTRIKTSCLDFGASVDVGDAVSMYFRVMPSFVSKLCILRASP